MPKNRLYQFIEKRDYLKKIILEYKRLLVTFGIQPPFTRSSENSANYWMSQGIDTRHGALKYLEADETTSELFKEVLPRLELNSPILEVGCNVGRDLNYLLEKGYGDLTGIEISPTAIKTVQERFPRLHETGKFFIGNAADVLSRLPDKGYDMVYAHGALVNIGPKYNSIFKDMARVSRKYIVTFENEDSFFAYPRAWQRMFEKHGFKMVVCKLFKNNKMLDSYVERERYDIQVLRIFVRKV